MEKTAVCLTCNTVVKTSGCTTNMMTHIRRVHPQLLSSRTTVQATTDPTTEAGPSERRQKTRQKQQTLQDVLAAQEKNIVTTIILFLSLCRHVFDAFSCNIHHEERYLKFADISFENIDTTKKYRDNINTILRRYPSPNHNPYCS